MTWYESQTTSAARARARLEPGLEPGRAHFIPNRLKLLDADTFRDVRGGLGSG